MTYTYGKRSIRCLREAHPDLQLIFNEAIRYMDISVFQGFRGAADQNAAFDAKKSKLKWPESKHNKVPSWAVDASPYPIDWDDVDGFIRFAHFIMGIAVGLHAAGKIKHLVRWGGDWDRDFDLKDQRFNDYPHFELYEIK